jgi:hypothetical protein
VAIQWNQCGCNAHAQETAYAESSVQSGEEHLPGWKRGTKDQQGVTIALTLRPKPLGKRHRGTDN